MTATTLQIKREFDAFAHKIAELESLKQQLHALPAKGFEHDVKMIEAKLKNVNALPEVKRDIARLKARIEQKKSYSLGHSKIDTALVQESKMLKRDTQALKRKLFEIQQTISDRKKLSSKPILTRQEKQYVQGIPNLEQALHKLKKKFAEHTASSHIKIDSGVGVLVHEKFDDFMNDLKGALTERLREKEFAIDAQLKADMNAREQIFAQKYHSLVEEFNNKFRKQVERALEREVRERFDAEVQKRLASEEREMREAILAEEVKRLHQERRQILEDLAFKFARKEALMRKAVMKEAQLLKSAVAQQRVHVGKKIDLLKSKEDKLHEEMAKAHNALIKEQRDLRKGEKRELHERQKKLQAELNKEKEKLHNSFNEKQKELKFRRGYLEKNLESIKLKKILLQKKIAEEAQAIEKEKKRLHKNEQKLLAQEKERLNSQFSEKQGELYTSIAQERANIADSLKALNAEKQILKKQEHEFNSRKTQEHQEFIEQEQSLAIHEREAQNRIAQEISAINKKRNSLVQQKRTLQEKLIHERAEFKELANKLQKRSKEMDKSEAKNEQILLHEKEKLHTIGTEELAEEKKKIHAQLEESKKHLLHSMLAIHDKQQILEQKNLAAKSELREQKRALQEEMEHIHDEEHRVLSEAKSMLSEKMRRYKENQNTLFQKRAKQLQESLHQAVQKNIIDGKKHEQELIRRELQKKERQLRKQLENEYKKRFNLELEKREKQLSQKKAELEHHILNQAKKLFR